MLFIHTKKVIHTDSDTGVQRLAVIHDACPGRHGYTGIIFTDNNEFMFVEDDEILTDDGTYNEPES